MSGSKVRNLKTESSVIVKRSETGISQKTAEISELQPGDQLSIELDDKGLARSITASYTITSGQVKTASKKSLLLSDGRQMNLNPNFRVLIENGIPIAYSAVRQGDSVSLKLNPETREIWRIKITESAAVLMIKAISHDGAHPLEVGEKLSVIVRGTSSASAAFSIKGILPYTKMKEIESGKYQGVFTVESDTPRLKSVPVTARISKDGKVVGPVQASRLISIEGSAQAVNVREITQKPEPPAKPKPAVISKPAPKPKAAAQAKKNKETLAVLRPSQGAKVHNPLVIVGKTKPGCSLRATITYSNGMTGLLKLEGTLCKEELKADSNGRFQSNPVTLPQAYAGKELDITVKVESVGETPSVKPVIVKVKTD
jgi:hypothetical protein